jgi:hypothetical protein
MSHIRHIGLIAFLAMAATAAEPAKIPTLTTTDGKTYKAVTITKVEPDGIRIMHDGGMAKIPFEKLSEALRKQHGYDPKKAAEHAAKTAAEDREQEAAQRQQDSEISSSADAAKTLAARKALAATSLRLTFELREVGKTGLLGKVVSQFLNGNHFPIRDATICYIEGYPIDSSVHESAEITGFFAKDGSKTFPTPDGGQRVFVRYVYFGSGKTPEVK